VTETGETGTGTETEPTIGTETEPTIEPETPIETRPEIESETRHQRRAVTPALRSGGAVQGRDRETEIGVTGTEAETETIGTETGTQTEVGTQTEAETQKEAETQAEAQPQTEAEMQTENSGGVHEAAAEVGAESGPTQRSLASPFVTMSDSLPGPPTPPPS
jgi:hypothetical protein